MLLEDFGGVGGDGGESQHAPQVTGDDGIAEGRMTGGIGFVFWHVDKDDDIVNAWSTLTV